MSSAADSHFEMSLRDQLIAAQNNQPAPVEPPTYAVHPPMEPQHHHLDDGMAIHHYTPPDQHPDHQDMADKRKTSRELSNTKRAAQNRAAQRAFRQRKEAYIMKLESDIDGYRNRESNFKAMEHDHYQLRQYVAVLHAKMDDARIDYPPVPPTTLGALPLHAPAPEPTEAPPVQPFPTVNQHHYDHLPDLSHEHPHPDEIPPHYHQHAPATDMAASDIPVDPLPLGAISQLQAAAAQAGELGSHDALHHDPPQQQQQQHHPEDPQYVQASEYPAPKRVRLDQDSEQALAGEGSST